MDKVLRVLKIERVQHAELPAAVTNVVVPPPLVLVKDEPKETVPEVAGHDNQSTALVLFSDTPVSKGNQILSQEDSLRKKEEGRWFTVPATGIRPSAPPPPPFQSYDDGGCSGDANTTKEEEEEEIAVSDHFPHSRHCGMTSRHEEKLQATVANGGGGAAAAIRISTQQEANNKTLLHTSSSKKRVSDECNEPQVQPPPRYLMRLLQAAAPDEEEMEKEKKPVQKNTKRHEESAAAVAASSSSSQVGSESKGQGLNPSSSGTPPNFVCQMISTGLPLQAEEKEEIHTDDDDALLPAIAQHSGARNGSTLELDFTTRQIQLQEMGFEEGLITQALRAHGAHADDSILVQFILDLQTNTVNNSIGSNNTEIVIENWQDEDEGEIPNHREEDVFAQDDSSEGERDEVETTLESCSYVPQPEQSIGQMPNKARTWDRPSSPVNPTEKYTRNQTFLLHQGFDPVLIEKVLVKFGDEDDINQLLDYALALANCDAASISMQNSMPSTSYSVPFQCQELVEAPAVNTVDKLVNEFKCTFSARAIERALERCETPRLNAKDHQIVALLDFLDAHGDELDQDVEACTMSNPRAKENTDWEDVRHLLAEEGQMSPKTMLPPTYRPPKKAKGLENIEPPEPKRKGAQGFGLPGMTVRRRHLSRDVEGAPFFYFENVATMPKGEWSKIQRHLYDIEPEFYDSLHFSACRRPRGYIHNLPVEGRVKILSDPPMTIQELMPQTQAFWPHWDPRTKFNCINTVKASQPICRKIQENLEVEEPPPDIQRMILKWCKTWNLVWTAPNLPSPISENEIEECLGFDRDHTRGFFATTRRFAALGNSFSVYTVAYHFSVLKPLYPNGIRVLSLFTGIGGAEIALHKIGIKLNVVVSVEIQEDNRACVEAWWRASGQTGTLDQTYHNVMSLGRNELRSLLQKYGGFDLIVGGSPCQNFSGNNRVNRSGLSGVTSIMFFEYSRITTTVREFVRHMPS